MKAIIKAASRCNILSGYTRAAEHSAAAMGKAAGRDVAGAPKLNRGRQPCRHLYGPTAV